MQPHRVAICAWIAVATMAALTPRLRAQQAETPARLPTVQVTVTRESARSTLELPFAVTMTRPDSMRPGLRHITLDETLFLLPGVIVVNRNNPTQDPRISIRGFGTRSAFGVRGVRVLRDGMPLTLPDGQTAVDYMDLESVGTVEVLRGSASALYGNASGGVVNVCSAEPPVDRIAVQARGTGGSEALRRWMGAVGGRLGSLGYQANVSHIDQDGYRQFSRQRATNGYGRLTMKAGRAGVAILGLALDMPEAEDPGALTLEQVGSDPQMADPFWVERRVRKEVRQAQLGVITSIPVARGELEGVIYGGWRDLFNPRPGFLIDLDRAMYGAGLRTTVPFQFMGRSHRLSAGLDMQRQADDRRNVANCNRPAGVTPPAAQCPDAGSERGVTQLDQEETVSSIGPFVRGEIEVSDRVTLMLGARADLVRFKVNDRLVTSANPDDSGERSLEAVSPMAGVLFRASPLHSLYANVSTAFETPTATELGNQADGSAGLNRDLDPQYATTYELGAKGILLSRLRYDVAGFHTQVRDELIPFDAPGAPGRRFFRNAGRTERRGVEAGVWALVGVLEVGASYGYSDFEFDDYVVTAAGVSTDFAGSRIPGVPVHHLQASVTWKHQNLFATAEGIAASSIHANDANTVQAPGYGVLNLRAGGTAAFGRPWLSLVVGVQNIFDKRYVASVVVNAAQDKFFEPAPGRAVYAGLTVAAGR
ncbi:MAG: TonB-dependent receptor family protein [Gemmatimonadaceae bacterium]